MKIDVNSYIKNYQGPSGTYYQTFERFNNILGKKIDTYSNPMVDGFSPNSSQALANNESGMLENSLISPMLSGVTGDNSSIDNASAVFANNGVNENSIANMYNEIQKIQNRSHSSSSKKNVPMAANGLAEVSDIRKKSNVSASTLNNKLAGSRLANMGEHFKRAEDLYGVNAYVLMAIAKLESNWGQSQIARDKNNLFGYGAYDSSPYESAKSYANVQESIYDVAKHLSQNYLSKDGPYYNGYSLSSVGKKYSTSPLWADKVGRIVGELIR